MLWSNATGGTRFRNDYKPKNMENSALDDSSDKPHDLKQMIKTLLDKRILILCLPCHREVNSIIQKLKCETQVPHFDTVSACSPSFFDIIKRTRKLAVLDLFRKDTNNKPSFCITDLDVLTTAQAKNLCLELREPRKENEGVLIVVWPSIPQKSMALLPEDIVVTSAVATDVNSSRLAVRSILTDVPCPRMIDHSELVPSCERSLVGLLVHANMNHLCGTKVNSNYLKALQCTILADPADRLSHASTHTPIVELSSMIRTIGVSQTITHSGTPPKALPAGKLIFTKLLAAHATIHTRLGAVRELCNTHNCTFRELAYLYNKEQLETDDSVASKRVKAIIT